MLFFYLYLGHLISDYLLQPTSLILWKKRSRWGIFAHASIHFLVTTLLAYLYTANYYSIILALAIGASHFLIDCLKVDHDKNNPHSHLAYWSDQFAHFITVLVAFLIATHVFPGIFSARVIDWKHYFDVFYFSPIFVTYSCLAIFSTLTIEYSFFLVKKTSQSKAALAAELSKRHMIKRLFLATLIYVGLLFSLVPSVGFNF